MNECLDSRDDESAGDGDDGAPHNRNYTPALTISLANRICMGSDIFDKKVKNLLREGMGKNEFT